MPVNLSTVIGMIGNVTSCALYASPIPTFCIIRRKRSTEMFSVLPYVSTLLTTLFGMYYGGMKNGGILILSVNAIGTLFEMAYIAIFVRYGSKAIRMKTAKLLLAEFLFFGIVVGVTYGFTHGKTRTLAIGSISSAVGLTMYIAPLSILRTVIRTKNVEPMPLTLSIFLLINGWVWSAFAFFARDIFVGIPSTVGCLFAILQIGVYVYCRLAKLKQDKTAAAKEVEENPKQHIVDIKDEHQQVNGDVKHKPASPAAIAPQRQSSLVGVFRTTSGRILKELPNGLAATRTASGKFFNKEHPYVELAKQKD